MTDDRQLLQQYAQERSESAFGELVTRHIDLVFSAALRVTGGDRHLAQDMTQMVFMDLARKAWSLPCDVVLAGWLYRHACYTAAKAVRTERRRKNREQTATEMRAISDTSEPPWAVIAPHLDESLNQLSASDRDAIVVRFLKRQDLRAVGAALGISEDAAQKRVSRALEKLRGVLSRRGVALTATALASVLAAEAVTAAPVGLALSVTAASVAVAAGTGTTLTLWKLLATTNLKAGIITAIVVASVATPLLVKHNAQARLREQDEALRQPMDQLANLQADNERLANLLAQRKSPQSLSNDQFGELLRLRGEIGRLRKDTQELAQMTPGIPPSRDDALASLEKLWSDRLDQLKHWLNENPSEKIPELQYLTDRDWINFMNSAFENEADYRTTMRIVRVNAEQPFLSRVQRALREYANANNGQFPTDLSQLKGYFKTPIEDAILHRYEIVPAKTLVRELQVGGDWAITQKAPVNEALDIRVAIGLTNWLQVDELVTNRWGLVH